MLWRVMYASIFKINKAVKIFVVILLRCHCVLSVAGAMNAYRPRFIIIKRFAI